MTDDYQ